MAASSTTFHEPLEQLKPETPNLHRAIVSLIEELEAIDWYRQRADACSEDQLKAILEHNLNEEIEHAAMVLEWLRRQVPKMDEALKTYLFTTGDITKREAAVTEGKTVTEGKAITAGKAGENAIGRPRLRTTIGNMKGS